MDIEDELWNKLGIVENKVDGVDSIIYLFETISTELEAMLNDDKQYLLERLGEIEESFELIQDYIEEIKE